jgi:two-component system, NarL family, nitrate/nitrite response regulator NarL
VRRPPRVLAQSGASFIHGLRPYALCALILIPHYVFQFRNNGGSMSTQFISKLAQPKVYIISDVRLYREGLTQYLNSHGGLQVLGAACSEKALCEITALKPDVALLDIEAEDSLSLPRKARVSVSSLQVIAFAVSEGLHDVIACVRAGMSGYITQDASADEVVDVVRKVIKGEFLCSPRITTLLFRELSVHSFDEKGVAPQESLTARESEIACLVACGLANKEIARRLRLSNLTIKNHVHKILLKLNAKRRSQVLLVLEGFNAWKGDLTGMAQTSRIPKNHSDARSFSQRKKIS